MVNAVGEPFSEVLRRSLRGTTLSWLAREVGIPRDRMQRLAAGRTEPKLAEVAAIAAALKVPATTFLPGGGE